MTNILINFAHNSHSKARAKNSETGLSIGGFDKTIEYNMSDIDKDFYSKNKHIFEQKRGAGYWLWKPYFILQTLKRSNPEDNILYCDAGCAFVGSFKDYFFDFLREDDKGVILFNGVHSHSQYTKMDCFHYMDCENDIYFQDRQLTATFQLVRPTKFSLNFYESYLNYCQDERILTDKENECDKPNFPHFMDHRHDQSILTNLKIKHQIKTFEDPSQWADHHGVREQELKTLIHHHRSNE